MAKSSPVPANEEIRRSLQERYEEHRKAIVGGAILAVVLAVGIILYVVMSQKAEEHRWYELQRATSMGSLTSSQTLEKMAEKGGADVRRNALLNLAAVRYQNRNYEGALQAIDTFEKDYKESFLAGLPTPDSRYALSQEIRRRAQAELEWQEKNAYRKAEPDTGRVALVETTKGDFWLGFYPEDAPAHVENFVKQAKAGAFNGTRVYAVTPQQLSFSGATTRDDDPMNDAEPDLANLQEPEKGRFWLQQSRGRVSSVAFAEGESKLRFTVVVGKTGAPSLDKKQTVFAEVLRDRGTGLDAIDAIANVVTYGKSGQKQYEGPKYAKLSDHPVEPIVIERVSIWSDGKIVEGHDWDTSAVTPPEKETPAAGPEKSGANGEQTQPESSGNPTEKEDAGTEEKPAEGEGSNPAGSDEKGGETGE